MNRAELLATLEAWAAERSGGRGRPRADTVADLDTGMRRFAVEVFIAELALGRRRGDLTKATKEVAARYRLKENALRKAVYRHRDLREVADTLATLDRERADVADILAWLDRERADWVELIRRMRDFPPDVRQCFSPYPAHKVLAFLRDEGIDGDCPYWLAEVMRGT